MTLDDITIVITTFNSDKKITSCLDSIANKCKVIIVENSKNKNLKKELEKKYSNVSCIIADTNLGYSKSNNLGLSKVSTRYSLILNPDTLLEENTLNNFISSVKKNNDFAILGPLLYQGKNYSLDTLNQIEVENLKGFAMFLNMEKFKKIGFFDENFFLYFEEIDLCKRVRNFKEKIYLDPTIKIFHKGASSVDDSFKDEIELTRNWHWMWSTFYYHKKHKNFLIALIIIFPKLFSSIFKVIFFSLVFNKKQRKIYYQRLSGIINSIIGKKSWYRPSLD